MKKIIFILILMFLISILSFSKKTDKVVLGQFLVEVNQNSCSDMILRNFFAIRCVEEGRVNYDTVFVMYSNISYTALGSNNIGVTPLDTIYTNKGLYLLYNLELRVTPLGCRKIDFYCKKRKSYLYEVTNCKVL